MIFVSLFKGRGKLIKLLEVKCETERTPVPVRYFSIKVFTAPVLVFYMKGDHCSDF